MRLLRPTLALVLLLIAAPLASAQNTRAAEAFAKAESAEQRKAWQAAIDFYKEADAIAPHPSVKYNIALNYERLGEYRQAARFYIKYVDNNQAKDRAKVMKRVEALRQKPSKVQFVSRPEGATIFVDGKSRGKAPLSVSLPAGKHLAFAEQGGQRSDQKQVLLEYGEDVKIQFNLVDQPGTLTIVSNVDGAEVRLDGNLVGRTPFKGQVAAGTYQVLVSLAGYETVQRNATVPAQGSEQLRVPLNRLGSDGTVTGAGEGSPASGTIGPAVIFGGAFGSDTLGAGGRVVGLVGYRLPGAFLEIDLTYGRYGELVGSGIGGEVRFYLSRKAIRFYGRGGAMLAARTASPGEDADGTNLGVEGGVGLLYSGSPLRPSSPAAYEFYIDIGLHYLLKDGQEGEMTVDMSENKFSLPVVFGIQIRWGGVVRESS